MAESLNHKSINTGHSEYRRTLAGDIKEIARSNSLKVATRLGLLAVGTGVAFNALAGLSGGNADPEKYPTNHGITSVTFEEGANFRHDPSTFNDIPFDTAESTFTIPTLNGAYSIEESDNGVWYGVNVNDLPESFDAHGDKDGKVWVNHQKASVSSEK